MMFKKNHMQINFLWAHSASAIEVLHYGIHETIGGQTLFAASDHGLTAIELDLDDNLEPALKRLAKKWPKSKIVENTSYTQKYASLLSVNEDEDDVEPPETLTLHIHGTTFQQVVWQELIDIGYGKQKTYQMIADNIGNPNAVRAVGSAIGANPIGLIIPCHRVVQSDGGLGGYRWGTKLKANIIESES